MGLALVFLSALTAFACAFTDAPPAPRPAGDHVGDANEQGPAAPVVSDRGDPHDQGAEPTTCAAHNGDLSRQIEHCAALALTDPSLATDAAAASGPWNDPSTWGGSVPADGARVHIANGLTVRVDTLSPSTIEWIRVDGELDFATEVDTELRVGTIVSSPTGRFEIGTAADPVQPSATARVVVVDDGPIDRGEDRLALGRGLVLHGTTAIHGAAKTPFVELAAPARSGHTSIELTSVPSGWSVGDELVLAGVSPDGSGDEVVQLAGIDGTRITLGNPLTNDHVGPRPELRAHVANLSRNVLIESEAEDVQRRGHLMFMHTTNVDVAYARLHRLGRTDKSRPLDDRHVDHLKGAGRVEETTNGQEANVRGRYAVHFHRAGVEGTTAASVRGSVVTESPGWGYVNHSSNVEFVDNVTYNVTGAAFVTEAGDEIGSFLRNISIRSHGDGLEPSHRKLSEDYGQGGNGFWFQGAGVAVEGNVATGATAEAFIFYTWGITEPESGHVWFPARNLPFDSDELDRVPVTMVPITSFRDNLAYGSAIGATVQYHRTGIVLTDEEREATNAKGKGYDVTLVSPYPASRIENLTLWSNGNGIKTNLTQDVVFEDLLVVGTAGEGIGIDGGALNGGLHRFERPEVSGYGVGLLPAMGAEVTVNGGLFDNSEHNILVVGPRNGNDRVNVTGDPVSLGGTSLVTEIDKADGFFAEQKQEAFRKELAALVKAGELSKEEADAKLRAYQVEAKSNRGS